MTDEASTVVCVRGTPVSPGLARGPLLLLREGVASGSGRRGSADDEAERLYAAIAAAIAELATLMERTDDTDAETILAFQVAMLDDAAVTDPAFAAVASGSSAEDAWRAAMELQVRAYHDAEDLYFRA